MTVILVHGIYLASFQAGLLTPGSAYLLRLPDDKSISGSAAVFVPGHSGGPVPVLHRIPFSSAHAEPEIIRHYKAAEGSSSIKMNHGSEKFS